ncbi:MAG: hypothetical protein V3V31_15825 [Methylococcales bacterium]
MNNRNIFNAVSDGFQESLILTEIVYQVNIFESPRQTLGTGMHDIEIRQLQ